MPGHGLGLGQPVQKTVMINIGGVLLFVSQSLKIRENTFYHSSLILQTILCLVMDLRAKNLINIGNKGLYNIKA